MRSFERYFGPAKALHTQYTSEFPGLLVPEVIIHIKEKISRLSTFSIAVLNDSMFRSNGVCMALLRASEENVWCLLKSN